MSIFFFNDTATTEIYTLSLHDALPISSASAAYRSSGRCSTGSEHDLLQPVAHPAQRRRRRHALVDRKSTRLNSSHANISYAVFCLKKKKHRTISDISVPYS